MNPRTCKANKKIMKLNNFDDFMNFIANLFTTYYYPVLIGVIIIAGIIIFFSLKSRIGQIDKESAGDKDKRSEMLLNLLVGNKPDVIKKIKAAAAKKRESEKNE